MACDVYLVSGSDDSDDGELSSSSGDDDSSEANIASARQWILLDVDNPPVKPPHFPFLAIPGKTFNFIVRDYNHTMGGVDKSDQMLSDYPVPRKRQKIYYKKIFRH
ncbi:hypothetical protein HPB49_016662 [Dermacentor silvarum]|uniref:Uncharacterized protein n=1 Tax=Dermacentor silvarum TaxID=543639 RepID=A0ACB8CGD3_DERSI|nr:hypothetical protein HPB49_016662 [Dermacentor silvarum]